MTDLIHPVATPPFDAWAFRRAIGGCASGIAVVTAVSDAPVGMTCQSFCSVSLDPPLVAFSPSRTSSCYAAIRAAGRFCINVLASEQHEISDQFARPGTDKWAGVDWTPSELGNPVIDGALLRVDCVLEAEHEAGDHYIVVGRVNDLELRDDSSSAFVYFRGRYTSAGHGD